MQPRQKASTLRETRDTMPASSMIAIVLFQFCQSTLRFARVRGQLLVSIVWSPTFDFFFHFDSIGTATALLFCGSPRPPLDLLFQEREESEHRDNEAACHSKCFYES